MSTATTNLTARWIFPVDRPPIECGVVEIVDGRIASVSERGPASRIPEAAEDLAIIPGLVNAHTHLEFSGLTAPLPADGSFTQWLAEVLEFRRTRDLPVPDAVKRGLRESAESGVTTIGEIATPGWTAAPFQPGLPRGVAFRESIALETERFAAERATIEQHLADLRDNADALGAVSPHAPYSVHPQLFEELVELASQKPVPVTVHLAETLEELEALQSGSGPMVELFQQMGFWQPRVIPPGSRPLDYLRRLIDVQRVLIAHGNYLDDEDIAFLSGRSNFSVIYCPRTHAYFRHAEHPWLRLRASGVRVALGTDGRCSNPDLSVWNEMLFLNARTPGAAPEVLLEMATRCGAEALGLEDRAGTLSPGQEADLTVVRLGSAAEKNPYMRLLNPDSRPIATMRHGRWIAGAVDGFTARR